VKQAFEKFSFIKSSVLSEIDYSVSCHFITCPVSFVDISRVLIIILAKTFSLIILVTSFV
jgi:hypothetical protein